ncbi:hypothetical protein DVH05_019631 [Phytophthora capsici]|nr:hypothetical protein DVH05_019631 [Phytophthora capsici]
MEAERDRLLLERNTMSQQLASISQLIQVPSGGNSGATSAPSQPSPVALRVPTPSSPSSRKRTRSTSEETPSQSKKRRSSSGSSSQPIRVDSGDEEDKEEDVNSDDSDRSIGQHSQTPGNSGAGGPDSPPSTSSNSSDGESDSGYSSSSDAFLSDNALGKLPQASIGRNQWIPGYQSARHFARRDVDPWPVTPVRQIDVHHLTVDDLFHDWSCPEYWVFPARRGAPNRSMWSPGLVTEANVRRLYDAQPWTALRVSVIPRSFDPKGWFNHFIRQYSAFEEEELQTFWESTHHFTITSQMRQHSSNLDQLCIDRKQRRSRAGPKWKKILAIILRGIVRGHCDIDLFLDPFILHFPRKSEQGTWYPGLGARNAPTDLLAALALVDVSEPWRNQFRSNPQDHPGLRVARLDGKFRRVVASSDSEEDQD